MADEGTKPTQTLSLEELSPYFHLPINDAATELGICSTALKKICRSIGVKRWPHRKIKSLDNMIESLQNLIAANEGDIPKMNLDMEDLLAKRKFLMENPNTCYKNVVSKYEINSFNSKIQKAQHSKLNNNNCSNSSHTQTQKLLVNWPKPTKIIKKDEHFNDVSSQKPVVLPVISSILSNIDHEIDSDDETLQALKSKFYSYVQPLTIPESPGTLPVLNPFPKMSPYMTNRPLRMSG